MAARYFAHIPLGDVDTLTLIKEAALRILRRHGRPVTDDQGMMLVAQVDGYTFRYYSRAPDTNMMPELPHVLDDGETVWPSSKHCIDIEASELLFGLAVDAAGLYTRRVVRGPWEYEIARAANMENLFRAGRPLPPCFPESRSRKKWPLAALRSVRKRRLRMPLRFSVAGYTQCIHDCLPSNSGFEEIASAVDECYRESRSYDGDPAISDGASVSSFGIWGWAGGGRVRLGSRMKKPDMSYWVSPVGGCEAAAALLLLLDKEYSTGRLPVDPAMVPRSPAVRHPLRSENGGTMHG